MDVIFASLKVKQMAIKYHEVKIYGIFYLFLNCVVIFKKYVPLN